MTKISTWKPKNGRSALNIGPRDFIFSTMNRGDWDTFGVHHDFSYNWLLTIWFWCANKKIGWNDQILGQKTLKSRFEPFPVLKSARNCHIWKSTFFELFDLLRNFFRFWKNFRPKLAILIWSNFCRLRDFFSKIAKIWPIWEVGTCFHLFCLGVVPPRQKKWKQAPNLLS